MPMTLPEAIHGKWIEVDAIAPSSDDHFQSESQTGGGAIHFHDDSRQGH